MDDSWGIFFGNGLMVPAMMNVIDSFFWHISCHDTYPQTTSNIVHEKYIGKFGWNGNFSRQILGMKDKSGSEKTSKEFDNP